MRRARVPSASLITGADALLLPWLAPRAFAAESPVSTRHQRRGGAIAKAQQVADRAKAAADVDERLSRCQDQARPRPARPRQPTCSNGPSCRTLTRPCAPRSQHLRYADIASFARRHVRDYTIHAPASGQSTATTATTATTHTANITNGSRYAGRLSWKKQLAEEAADLAPEEQKARRFELCAKVENRLHRHRQRLRRANGGRKVNPLYDGQYRSMHRFLFNIKNWNAGVQKVWKDNFTDVENEPWLLRTFAALERSIYPSLQALTKPIQLHHAPECRDFAQRLLDDVQTEGETRFFPNWYQSHETPDLYEGALVYMLDRAPGFAQDFITTLAHDDRLDMFMPLLADAFAYLGMLHVKGDYPAEQGWEATPELNTRKFVTAFLTCMPNMDPSVYSQDLLHSLIVFADTEDTKKIFSALVESEARFALGTTLHFASAFGEVGEFRLALQCLQHHLVAAPGAYNRNMVNFERFLWTCAVILRGSMLKAKEYHETPAIVAAFVELGVELDLLLYNVVMSNAMEAGDYATAFRVFNALESNGLKPDKHTLSILLHGCTIQPDPAMFTAYAEFCRQQAKELEDSWLGTDFVYYKSICEQNKDDAPRDASSIWDAYLDLFDLAPLRAFVRHGSRVMKDAVDRDALKGERKRLDPLPSTLYHMLKTEIHVIEPLSIHYLENLYKTFKRAISSPNAHPALVDLSRQHTIWNVFLHAFCKRHQHASAYAILDDMTAHSTPPDVYSWNILMHAMFKSGQVAAADRILELMRAHGIDPDAFTYKIMVRGYAKAQLVDRVAATMQHLPEEPQLAPDLLHALSQVQKRTALGALLEKNRLAKLRTDAEEKERKAKAEEQRFQPPTFKSLFARAVTFKEPTHWDHGTREEADDFMEPDDDVAEPVASAEKEDVKSGVESASQEQAPGTAVSEAPDTASIQR